MADEQEQGSEADEAEEAEDFQYIVRVQNTDLDGHKPVMLALAAIKGVGERIALAVTDETGIPRDVRIGDLPEEDVETLSQAVANIPEFVPSWMINRRKDYRTGADIHILRAELDNTHRDDLNRLAKIRSYRGIRHEQGAKVRGQRTRANGRTGLAMGVQRAKQQAQQ